MGTYRVYEIVKQIEWIKYLYELEAEDEEHARDLVECGESPVATYEGQYGKVEWDFDTAGISVALVAPGVDDSKQWAEAAKDIKTPPQPTTNHKETNHVDNPPADG